MIKITNEILAGLTFMPLAEYVADIGETRPDDDNRYWGVDYQAKQRVKERVFTVGNVLQLKSKVTESIAGRAVPGLVDTHAPEHAYELVGHINDMAGFCDDCTRCIDDIEAVAHISELFK